MNKLQKLKEVIRKANPEICKQEYETCDCTQLTGSKYYCRSITIGDVLIAFEKRFNNFGIETLKVKSSITLDLLKVIKSWNLLHDLDWHAKNRPDVVEFLTNLLVTK